MLERSPSRAADVGDQICEPSLDIAPPEIGVEAELS
jgi:hypothetical protein